MSWLLFIFLCVTLLSCNDHVIFQEREELPEMIWKYSNPLEFSTEIADKDESFNIYLDIEHSRDFAYGNLYSGITVIAPSRDTTFHRISIDLADKLGQWLGTCKGNECSRQFLIAEEYQIAEAGNYKIIIEQYSREEDLPGIKSIELTIHAAE